MAKPPVNHANDWAALLDFALDEPLGAADRRAALHALKALFSDDAISPAAYLPSSSTSRRAGARNQKCSVRLLISPRKRYMKMPRQPKKIASRR